MGITKEEVRYVWFGIMQYSRLIFWGLVLPVVLLVIVPWVFRATTQSFWN